MSMFVKLFFVLLAVGGCWSELLSSRNIGELISGVYYRCKAAGVTFSTTTSRLKSLDLHPFFAGSIRYLSKGQIPSGVVTFPKLNERIHHYHRHFGRPLIVVIIRTRREISQFKETTREISMSSPIWMVIFANIDTNRWICEFCRNPTENHFQLKNESEFFVSCCTNTELEEWWSKDGENLEVLPVGRIINQNLQWAQNESSFHQRRHVGQLQLRIGFIQDSSTFWMVNSTYSGVANEVLTSLMQLMNFSIAPPILANTAGFLDKSRSKWTGAMGLLQRGEVDLIVSLLVMTNERMDYAEATVPIISTTTRLYIKVPEFTSDVQWQSYLQIFRTEVWITIVVILFLTTALLTLIKYNPRRNELWSVISESFHQLFGIFCQQGLPEFPKQPSLRITYFSIFLTALVVLASFSANVMSVLTVPPSSLPFTSLEEFTNQVNYKMITIRDSGFHSRLANSKEPMEKKMFEIMKPKEELPSNYVQALQQICNERVAYYGSIVAKDSKLPCKIVGIGNHMVINGVFMMQRGSPYTEIINKHIIKLHNNGFLKHLKQKYYDLKDISPDLKYEGVAFQSVFQIFLILCGGILMCLLILLFEIIYYRYTRKLNSKPNWTVQFKHLKLKSLKETPIFDNYP